MEGTGTKDKTIGVIGTFVSDLIEPYGGTPTRSLGGIYYTVTYLAAMFDKGWTIRPVARVGADIYERVVASCARHAQVDVSQLHLEERPNTQVRLTYLTENVRQEVTTEPMAPLSWDQVQGVVDADVVLVNFITGEELSPTSFASLSEKAKGLIYTDYHSLAWARDASGRRSLWKNPHWELYVSCADIVQMNEHEAASLMEISPPLPLQALRELARQVLQGRARMVLVTLAERGAFVGERTGTGIRSDLVPAWPVERVVDPTGCGDAFAAAFLRHYLANSDTRAAVEFANRVASINCTLLGAENIEAMKRELAQIESGGRCGKERST
ncbi:MAG: carbohydrate kinase family protein [candidate division KSB1 bacterium]|nr:carbohydrate kinase family protein [candidate division KSB1 bacterium]